MSLNYSSNGDGALDHTKVLIDGSELRFTAKDIRRQATGVHARVGMFLDGGLLAWSNFNTDRSADRTTLAGKAHRTMSKLRGIDFLREELEQLFDLFCLGLWEKHIGQFGAESLAGDATLGVEFLLKPYQLSDGGTLLFAPPGSGKSYIALLWAVSVDAGVSQFFEVKQAPVLFLNLERSRSNIQRRLGCINTALGLDPSRALTTINARGKPLSQIRESIAESVRQRGVKLVVVDSISRTGQGDLVKNEVANSIIDQLNDLAPAWMALAHTPRADSSHIFGGVHFDAGADVVVRLLSDRVDDRLAVGLSIVKANDIGIYPMSVFEFGFDSFGLQTIEKSSTKAHPSLLEGESVSLAQELLDYISQEAGRTTASLASKILRKHRSTIARVLSSDKRFLQVTAPVGSREKWYGVTEDFS